MLILIMVILALNSMHVHSDTKNQSAGGDARRISDAAEPGGTLAGLTSPRGVDNLLGLDGSIEDKYTMKASMEKRSI